MRAGIAVLERSPPRAIREMPGSTYRGLGVFIDHEGREGRMDGTHPHDSKGFGPAEKW